MRFSILAIGAFTATVLAIPSGSDHVLHEKRVHEPVAWAKRQPAHGKKVLPMRIGLQQSNLDKGYDMLMDVSSHDSSNYGKYFTPEQIHEIFAPAEDSVEVVRGWLEKAGIAADRISQSVNKQWMQFDVTVEEAERLLKTKYNVWEHLPTGRANIACDEYHVPDHVSEHVDYITPGIKLFTASGKVPGHDEKLAKRTFLTQANGPAPPIRYPLPMPVSDLLDAAPLATCGVAATPACIAAMYNITKGDKAAKGNELGIFEDLGDVYSQEDLNLFFASFAPQIPQGTHPELRAIDGAVAPNPVTSAGPESDLDFEISYPIIYPQGSVLFQTDDPVYEANYMFEGFLNNFLDAIDGSYCNYPNNPNLDPPYPDPQPGGYKGKLQCGVYKPTNVISISYGGQEPDLPISYQRRQCNEFMKLGMQGISILVASGDSGVSARGDYNGNADGCLGPQGKIFNPDFPATCPYLTTAGATYLPPGADASKDEEVAVTRFPSGGGFSNIYTTPSYQKQAVSDYFNKYANSIVKAYPYYNSNNNNSFGANGGIYNRAGRGYPDISAVGDNVVVYAGGTPTLIGGTSAAAPAFAAILNRINEERIAAGKKTVGFVNPVLYKHPEVLHDITVGNNSGCGTGGFYASKGWDPVTGLGTPNYPAMLKLFMSLP